MLLRHVFLLAFFLPNFFQASIFDLFEPKGILKIEASSDSCPLGFLNKGLD